MMATQSVVLWREGKWQCELHGFAETWRFHVYCASELLVTWALSGEAAFDRVEAIRHFVNREVAN